MLSVEPADEAAGVTSLSGNLAREKEETKSFSKDSDHLENLGVMIEAMENTLRSDMDSKEDKEEKGDSGLFFSQTNFTFVPACSRQSIQFNIK